MAERATIQAVPRTVLGKKVKLLRRAGVLPGNVYGKGLQSAAIQMDGREFTRIVRAAGARSMFELKVEGEASPRFVVLRGLTRVGGTGDPMHVDFYQVDLARPIHANVALRVVGEAPAVIDLAGSLLQSLEHVSVSCLPLNLPEYLEVDAGLLNSFDVHLSVSDIKAPEGVQILTDPAIVVASVSPPRIQVVEEEEAE